MSVLRVIIITVILITAIYVPFLLEMQYLLLSSSCTGLPEFTASVNSTILWARLIKLSGSWNLKNLKESRMGNITLIFTKWNIVQYHI